ncbi:MAG: hypothetical protein AAGE37_00505 [Pseudomonadota bacterium]
MLTAVVIAAEVPVLAAEADTPERFSVLLTYGDDKCPEPEGDEIVVCAREPESERYRIPKPLRKSEEELAADRSWTSRVEQQDEISRTTRPGSCSVVGTFGFSGCTSAAIRRWFEERRNGAE